MLVAGCSSGVDPCASFGGQACVSVEVRGLDGTLLDQLRVESAIDHTDQLDPKSPRVPPVKTPLQFAYLPMTTGAPFDLTVSGLRNGDALGRGTTNVSVNAGEHRHAVIELEPLTVGGGEDLAGVDLFGVDLAGLAPDLSSKLDLSLQSSTDLACGGGAPDEDSDGLTDACDPCPIDPSTLDSDFDGVGDSCDPNPTMGGNHILFFEGFSFEGGQETLGGATTDALFFNSASGDFRVEVKLHLSSPATEANAGIVVTDKDLPTGSGVTCVMRHSMSTGVDGVSADVLTNGSVTDPGEQFARFSTSDATILRLTRKGSTWTCQATVGSDTPVVLSATFAGATPNVHMQATGVTASFDYLIVESVLP
jgi:hypothetical protein